jgi:hypothetical protein
VGAGQCQNDLEPQLTRNGYDIRSLVEQFDASLSAALPGPGCRH